MNKWKQAFWYCFVVLLLVISVSCYFIIDQSITMTYQKDGYEDTEEDFNQIIKIVNETDLSKTSIQNELRAHENYQYMNFKSDTISLNRALLIFKNNKLKKIVKHW